MVWLQRLALGWIGAGSLLLAGVAAAQTPLAAPPGRISASEVVWGPQEAQAQEQAFAAAVEGIAPQTPGVRDVFVLSAGLWSDNVFFHEASEGAKVLARRYGAEQRTLTLANGPAAAAQGLPAATPLFFNRALSAIAARMDREDDVLVLFITSHGAPKQGAVFHDEGRLTGALTPGALASALAEIGVRHRIVIISACFAGAYIPPLQDPNTIVLAAAAQDRTSFGCEPERDWTWFGDAFLNVAMRGPAPLPRAFEMAKATIQGWEGRQGQRPSLPSAYFGADMAALLPEIEKTQRPRN